MVLSILLIPAASFWDTRRKRLAVKATLFAIALGICIIFFGGAPRGSAFDRGDFPAFYSASVLVATDNASKLYDTQSHLEIQSAHWPDSLSQSLMMFAYPPYVAWILQPLANLDGRTAKRIFDLLLLLCLFAAAHLIGKHTELGMLAPLAALLAFSPLLHAVFASQNTSLSLLLLTVLLIHIKSSSKYSALLLGLALGLWLFKPQFPVVFGFLFLLSGLYRPLIVASIIGIVFYLIGSLTLSLWWVPEWIEAASIFADTDRIINGYQMISIVGVFSALGNYFSYADNEAWLVISIFMRVFQLACLTECIAIFYRLRKLSPEIRQKLNFLSTRAALPLILLSTEHLLYYDIALLIPAALLSSDSRNRWNFSTVVLFYLFAAACIALKSYLPIQPLFFLLLAAAILWNRDLRARYSCLQSKTTI